MKNILFAMAILLTNISCSNAQTKFSKKSLESVLVTIESQKIPFQEIIKKHHGKTVVIEFWASWCSDCVKSMPKLKELQGSNPDVSFVFISFDKSVDKWKTGIEKHALVGDHYLVPDANGMKSDFGQSLDINWIPRYIVVDKSSNIALYKAIETDFDKIQETISNIGQ